MFLRDNGIYMYDNGILFMELNPVAKDIIETIQNTDGVILTNNECLYVNFIVSNLIEQGIWTKIKALYGFVGGTAATHRWNWKDMRDLDAAYRLSFLGGGWIHSSTGAKPNGTSSYADTFLNASTFNSASNGIYIAINRTFVTDTGGEDLFTASLSANVNNIRLRSRVADFGATLYFNNGTIYNENINIPSSKFTSINRLNTSRTLMGDAAISSGTTITNDLDLVNIPIVLGCRSFIGGRQFYSNNEYNSFIISDGLSLNEQIFTRNIITFAQGILNRK